MSASKSTLIMKWLRYGLVVMGIAVLLFGAYLGGNIFLPIMILSNYHNRDCRAALIENSLYTNIYPDFMIDQSLTGPVKECALYALATEQEDKKAWQDAYNAYKAYSEIYPQGKFASEAGEHRGAVLVELSNEQASQKQYGDAIGSLKLVLRNYADSPSAKQVPDVLCETYKAWVQDSQKAGDFAVAEMASNEYKTWAEQTQRAGDVRAAQLGLAQTYLGWGLALQTEKKFEEANAKFELALSNDPQPTASDGPAASAKADLPKLYQQWGNVLLEQKDYAGAVDRYKMAVGLYPEKDQPAAKDILANGYLKWADNSTSAEDFLGALGQLKLAKDNAAGAATKKSIEVAQTDLYTAFSSSDGSQAQKAMQDAMTSICEKKKKPDLPIFGTNNERIGAAVYGTDEALPDSVVAKTPGELHYVACVQLVTERFEYREIFFPWVGKIFMIREHFAWEVTLWQIDGDQPSATTRIDGGVPPKFPLEQGEIIAGGYFQHYKGTYPDINQLAAWMLNLMK